MRYTWNDQFLVAPNKSGALFTNDFVMVKTKLVIVEVNRCDLRLVALFCEKAQNIRILLEKRPK